MELHNTKIDLPADKRGQIIDILNRRLADATDLKSQAKQAHWNVKGANFIALHELFDEIAERVTALGGTAMGTLRVAAQNSSLSEYPLEITDGTAHVDALSTALADFSKRVRQDIDTTDEMGDAVTADLFTNISKNIDKYLWFVEAHNQA